MMFQLVARDVVVPLLDTKDCHLSCRCGIDGVRAWEEMLNQRQISTIQSIFS